MSFLQPLMLLGLIGAAVPVIIHLIHKRRPRRQQFAAIEFVLRSVQRVQRRWRLKRFLLLASRVLLLAALALAAARPMFGGTAVARSATDGPERLAIVLDGSLSMRARTEDGRSAFDRARTMARNLVDAMGPEDQLTIVLAGAKPELLVPRPIAAKSKLLKVLRDVQPTYGSAELAEAVSAAADALTSATSEADPEAKAPAARVVVLSDLAGHGIRSAADLSVDTAGTQAALELLDVNEDVPPRERSNHAITRMVVSNAPGRAPRSIEVRVRVRSFVLESSGSEAAVPTDITLRGPTGNLYVGSVDLVAGTAVDKVVAHAFDEPGFFDVAVVLEPDGLEEDDVRYRVADVRHTVRTLIVDGAPSGVPKDDEIFYLERALASAVRDQPTPRVITADDLARTDLTAYDVVVLAGVDSLGREDGDALVAFVEGGGGLLITTSAGIDVDLYNAVLGPILPRRLRGMKLVDAANGAGASGAVTFGATAAEHPVTSVFAGDASGGLLSTKTTGYLLLHPDRTREARTLIEYENGQPALIEAVAGRGRTVLLTTTVDRDLSDLPIRPAFLPLMRRLLLHLGDALTAPDDRRTLVGEAREIRVPKNASGVEITAPDGTTTRLKRTLSGADGTLSFADTTLPGHYAVAALVGGQVEPIPGERFAVNVDPRESDLRPLSIEEATAVLTGTADASGDVAAASTVASIARGALGHPEKVAAWLLLLVLLAFALESALTAQRPGS